MIVKKFKRDVTRKPKATMISGLVDYILAAKDDQDRDKLVYANNRNFLTTTVAAQKMEMITLAQESVQSKMPVAHWMLSWDENEVPSNQQVDEAVALFLERMELGEHQAIYALHGNTENYHVHILVNRVHPYTEKVIQPHRGFDLEAAHKAIAEIEHKQGWHTQRDARYHVNTEGGIVKRSYEISRPKTKAAEMERSTGEKSVQHIVRDRGWLIVKKATSWQELHEGLKAVGLRYERQGSGAVFRLDKDYIKASSIDRGFTLAHLQKRLGPFVEGNYPIPPEHQPEPLNYHCCTWEWKQYKKEHEDEVLRVYCEKLENHIKMRDMLVDHDHERQAFRNRMPQYDPALQTLLEKYLLKRQKKEERDLRISLPKVRGLPKFRFKDWLRKKHGQYKADLWRHYNSISYKSPVVRHTFETSGALPDHLFLRVCEIAKVKLSEERVDGSRIAALALFYLRCLGLTEQEAITAIRSDEKFCSLDLNKQPDMLERLCHSAYGARGDITASYINALSQFCREMLLKAAKSIPLHTMYGTALYPQESTTPQLVKGDSKTENLEEQFREPSAHASCKPEQEEGFFKKAKRAWLAMFPAKKKTLPEEDDDPGPDVVLVNNDGSYQFEPTVSEWQLWEDMTYANAICTDAWPEDYEWSQIRPVMSPKVVITEVPRSVHAPKPTHAPTHKNETQHQEAKKEAANLPSVVEAPAPTPRMRM